MMRYRRIAAAACLALAAALAAAQTPRVTVLPFEGIDVGPGDLQALTLFFETALQNTGRCQIIEQTEVDKILKAHQYVLADFNDPTKAVAIGRLIPADHIVLGAAGRLGSKYYVNVKMIDLRTGTIVGARNATAETIDRLSASLGEVATAMMGLAPARSESAAPAGLAIREAALAFFESGPTVPPYGQRAYAASFESRFTRFINWELKLQFPATQAPLTIPVEVRFLRADGSVLTVQTLSGQVEAGWDWFACWNGWGAANTDNWARGTYTVQAFVHGSLAASATFSVR